MSWVRFLLTVSTVILIAWLLKPLVARAHEPYGWIAKHYGVAAQAGDKWKDGDFGGCCGKQDCFPVPATLMERGGVLGWRIEDMFGGFVPDKEAQPSHDPQGRHWRCYNMKRDMALGLVPESPRVSDGKPCFFPSRGDF